MLASASSFDTRVRYPVPDPHRAPAGVSAVGCAEATTPRRVYPREAALLRADALAPGPPAACHRVALPLSGSAAAFVRSEAWCVFGYARLDDAARERFSRSGTWVRQLAQVGEAAAAAVERAPGARPPRTFF